jgi:hypothetical protein
LAEPVKRAVDRQRVQSLAHALQNPAIYEQMVVVAAPQSGDPLEQRLLVALHSWGYYGAQSVVMPETYAAALMATDAHNALEGQQLPWPAFEIQVPPGLLTSDHGDVFDIIVCERPSWVTLSPMLNSARYFLTYNDARSSGSRLYDSLEGLFGDKYTKGSGSYVPEDLGEVFHADREERLWSMITRLVAGVILAVNMARADKPEAFPRLPRKEKHGALKANTHKLGQPLTIDCRASIRNFVEGKQSRGPTNVSTLVRGHWRQQAHGPRHTLRRVTWIQPHWRGEGPLNVRTTHLKGPGKVTA